MSSFEAAVPVVLAHEGGWLSAADDPVGGETNFGVSELIIRERALTSEELGIDPNTIGQPGWLKAMPRANAIEIYRKYFWLPPYEMIAEQTSASKLFDAAVNMGPMRAHALAQVAVGATADGLIGPLTVNRINDCNATAPGFVQRFSDQLAAYYRKIAATRSPEYAALWLPIWLKRARWGLPT